MRLLLTVFFLALAAGSVPGQGRGTAEPVSLDVLLARIEKERDQPAAKRTATLNQLRRLRTVATRNALLDLWRREKDDAVRPTLISLLGNYDDARVLNVLIRTFEKTEDPALKRAAAYALARGGRDGVQVLIRALRSKVEATRLAAITALGNARDNGAATAALVKLLRSSDTQIRYRALSALRYHTPSESQMYLLRKLLRDEYVPTRCEALRQLAAAGAKGVRRHALEMAQDPKVIANSLGRGAITGALARNLDDETLPVLLQVALLGGASVEQEIKLLAKDEKHAAKLRETLAKAAGNREDAQERAASLTLLAHFAGTTVQKAARRGLEDPAEEVILAAMQLLRQTVGRKGLSALRRFLTDPREQLRLEAYLILDDSLRDDPSWERTVLAQLEAESMTMRLAALESLAAMRLREALAPVHALFEDPAWQIRSAAYAFCGALRDKSSLPLLIGRLRKESGRLEAELLTILESLTHLDYHKAEYWEHWWRSAGASFVIPPAPPKRLVAASRRSSVTFYRLPLVSRRASFILDVSGSMSTRVGTGEEIKLDYAKRALLSVIDKCEPELHFNLFTFHGKARRWVEALTPASEENRERAREFIQTLRASGGTNVHDAVQMAFDDPDVDTLYLVSDGFPSSGPITNIQRLADEIRKWNRSRRIVIHTVAIGHDSPLLERLAKESGGQYIRWI